MTLKLIKDYKDIPAYRLSFNELAGKIFGIDFEKWYRLGFWNDTYKCYSMWDGNRVVANISASELVLIVEGKRINAMQIGTVMTDPEYRNRGLAAKLMNAVLEEYENKCELIYLFANRNVLNFYPKFGFTRVPESRFSVETYGKSDRIGEIRKLDLTKTDDLRLVTQLSRLRIPVSNIMGVDGAGDILAWHCLNSFPEDIYYLTNLDSLVIAKVKDDTLLLYDVISKQKLDFKRIFKAIAPKGVNKVLFYFTPDFEDIRAKCCNLSESENDILFVRTRTVHLNGEIFYPLTAHT